MRGARDMLHPKAFTILALLLAALAAAPLGAPAAALAQETAPTAQ